MKKTLQGIKTIAKEQRGLLAMMVVTFLLAGVLFIFTLIHLAPGASVTKVGYGDIGGYRDGGWGYPLVFLLLALATGVLHNLLAVKIFQKSGVQVAVMFIGVTMVILMTALVTLGRLVGEG